MLTPRIRIRTRMLPNLSGLALEIGDPTNPTDDVMWEASAHGRTYTVYNHERYRVPVLRVSFAKPWNIDGTNLRSLEFFKFTHADALATRKRAWAGIVDHGHDMDVSPHYFVSGRTVYNTTHRTMLNIVPIETRTKLSRAYEVSAFGGYGSAEQLKGVALKIMHEDKLKPFFDLTPEPTVKLQ